MNTGGKNFYKNARLSNSIKPQSNYVRSGELPILTCFGLGVFSLLLGLFTLLISGLAGEARTSFENGGLIAVSSGFLMLMGGAHLMDKADAERKRERQNI